MVYIRIYYFIQLFYDSIEDMKYFTLRFNLFNSLHFLNLIIFLSLVGRWKLFQHFFQYFVYLVLVFLTKMDNLVGISFFKYILILKIDVCNLIVFCGWYFNDWLVNFLDQKLMGIHILFKIWILRIKYFYLALIHQWCLSKYFQFQNHILLAFNFIFFVEF